MTSIDPRSLPPFFHEPADDTPLVWMNVIAKTGWANDPAGKEGLLHHTIELARRGTSTMMRTEIDDALDSVGASLDATIARDYCSLSTACLADHLNDVVEIVSSVLSTAIFDPEEHRRLRRETNHMLDELRDDDESIAERYFNRHVAPGYAYARTSLGTSASLDALDPGASKSYFSDVMTSENLVLGFAGDVDGTTAERIRSELLSATQIKPRLEDVSLKPAPTVGPRIVIVDKPGRSQSQIIVGRVGPEYGTPSYLDLLPAATAFGGMFSSTLMQEIRVKRGWSYGAYCHLGKSRGPHWLELSLAPSIEQTVDALELTLKLMGEAAGGDLGNASVELAKKYLIGQLAFQRSTANHRLWRRLESELLRVDSQFCGTLDQSLAAVTAEQCRDAAARWLSPDGVCIVVVTTAERIRKDLDRLGIEDIETVAYDSY